MLCRYTTGLGLRVAVVVVVGGGGGFTRGSQRRCVSLCTRRLLIGWLLACLTSQQHASVSQGRICEGQFYVLPH